jgi:hypothetical protein
VPAAKTTVSPGFARDRALATLFTGCSAVPGVLSEAPGPALAYQTLAADVETWEKARVDTRPRQTQPWRFERVIIMSRTLPNADGPINRRTETSHYEIAVYDSLAYK